MDSLQIILIVGLAVLAIITAISLLWAVYLNGRLRQRPVPRQYKLEVDSSEVFSKQELTGLGERAEADLEAAVAHSSEELTKQLEVTMANMNAKVKTMVTQTLAREFQAYHTSLAELRKETLGEFAGFKSKLDEERKVLLDEFQKTLADEREKRAEDLNNRVADVVSTYIAESLDSQIDLGAQMKYIIASLEAKKDDIKKDILAL